ncbi:putative ankyrin repeat protein RF_0381 isoform X3 [Zophobas morio]|uniref:putative ankyrin repeat protein RF_0381 isoform X3 n=1 Tax=Zophobas morio TaxID=2755281 RepID=UPI0030838130
MTENNLIAIIESNEIQEFIGCDSSQQFNLNHVFESGSTLLSWAVRKSNLENVSSLVRRGAKVNKPERGGATLLLLAVHLNRPEIVTYLLIKGASVNLGDSYDTPLTVAVRKQHLEIVKVLVDTGAKINVVNIDGLSPLFWAIKQDDVKLLKLLTRRGIPKKSKDSSGDSPFIAAVKNGCSRQTIQCLVKNGAHIHETALICAATKGQLVVIQVLIENGADGNMVSTSVRLVKMEKPLSYGLSKTKILT